MNHDVFISYSHKNITAAQAICHELEDKGIKCWMAPRDIPVGAKYASVISKAIVHSKIVVLVFSDYSARSPWVESEINIAFSNRKTIIPYKIDKTNYEEFDEFYLMLNNRHWIEAYPDYKTRFKELVTIVAQTLGRNVSASKPAMTTPTLAPAPIPTPTQKQSSETLMPTSKPNNLKRYWWVTICVLILGVAIWGVLPENSVEPIELVIQEKGKISDGTPQDIIAQDSADSEVASNAELEELRAEKARIEKENETLKHDNAELQHSNAELQNSNSDLQKNINDFKAKEAQQSNNKKKENLTVKSPTQKQPETKPSTSTPKVEQKSVQTATVQKAETEEDIVPIMQPQEQVKQEVVVSQPETPKEKIIVKNNEYAGRSEREIYLLNLPDNEFKEFLKGNKWGFKLNKEIVISPKYSRVHIFSESLASVKLNGRWGFINKLGELVIPLKYDGASSFSEGLAMVKLNGRWGFINKLGELVIPLKYDGVSSFSEGLAMVKLNGKWGYIDKTGKEVIPMKYDEAWEFTDGKAKVWLNGEYFYIDKNGNRL